MKKAWSYFAVLAIGIILGMLLEFAVVKNTINRTEITTKRIVQKRNTDSTQDITNIITKREQRKENKRLRKANNNKKQ